MLHYPTSYGLRTPDRWDYHGNPIKLKAVATSEQVEMMTHLIESLQPADAVEVALACQFAITFIRGMEEKNYDGKPSFKIELFEFGHQVLEALQNYCSKGAQQISVQYNVNRGQIVNVESIVKKDAGVTLEEAAS